MAVLNATLALLLLFSSLIPAQTKSVASGISIQTGEACSGLSDEECCGQMLEYAGFKAQGEHLERKISATVKLACMQEQITPHVCRSIVMTRGFAPKEVDAICKPARAKRECGKDGTCRQCIRDLRKLDYKDAHNACHAVTYVAPRRGGTSVVVIREGGGASGDGVEITRRRTRVR